MESAHGSVRHSAAPLSRHNLMRFSKRGNPSTPAGVSLAIGSVVSQRNYRINLESATCRQIASGQRNQQKQQRHGAEGQYVRGTHTIEKRRKDPRCAERAGDAHGQSKAGQAHAKAYDVAEDLPAGGAERHADADIASALGHNVGKHAIDTNRGEQKRGASEEGEEKS